MKPDAPSSSPSERLESEKSVASGSPIKMGIAGALVRGTLWSVGLRWGNRVIGMISTLVVARLLLPADYGLIAMATLVLGLVQTFLDADAATALLRSEDPSKELQDSAWTLTVMQSFFIATLVAIAAPFASRYFEEPRLTDVIFCYAGLLCLSGLQSIGPLIARKDFNFALEVKVMFSGRIATLIATIILAYTWRTYWALIVGQVIGSIVVVVVGYLLHPFRPRLTLAKAGQLWHFSQWMLVSGIGTYFSLKADGFIVGRVGAARDLGLYNIALELGIMVTTELGAPLNRALLPVLSTLHAEPERLRSALMQTVAAVNTFTMPAGIGLAMVAPLVLAVVLGPQWSDAAPLLALFAFMGAFRFLVGPYYTLFLTLGKSRVLAMMSWMELGVFIIAASIFWSKGVTGVADARVVACVVYVGIWVVVGRQNGLAVRTLARALMRPTIGCACLVAMLLYLPMLSTTPIIELAYRIAVGATTYVVTMIVIWFAMGKPHGIEHRLFDHLTRARHA
jgi:lipopolysaccharide exporter